MDNKNTISDIFGSMVFGDKVMKDRLPSDTYKSLKKTIHEGKELDDTLANVIASAMKDWAIERGATHYTHWFQPMTGITAEKHDSFISPYGEGEVIMEFSGKELIKGEPDASSFPSGGLRATFEARGYTAWDPTSYAFIKDHSLCIPTVFCSYGGEVLDKKTPLLRSAEVISRQAVRLLHLFGDTEVTRVLPTVGAEQEYFLIDRKVFELRKDLKYTGRTLFGARPPKLQELEDHYFGAIRPRVAGFMEELNEELWKLGVYAKTEHNEASPAQHELAPVFTTFNMATDQNQLTMEIMKRVAEKHGLACLLHEKPFAGVNGSGKHNNWSLCTNTGVNLFKPGKKVAANKRFLIFVSAVIKAVDLHQDLLRISIATAGNDHRLGANEAPPAILSVFLGEEITEILESIRDSKEYTGIRANQMDTGVSSLPWIRKDTTDRNRTSPFAFTGNKFEFRMPGASTSIAEPNTVLNTAVADVLDEFAGRLENAPDFEKEVESIIRDTMREHSRIIFNGNNYDPKWVEEAEKRGLLNLRTTAQALPLFKSEKNIKLFTNHGIYNKTEIESRCELLLDSYTKLLRIEALTLSEITVTDILPCACKYMTFLSEALEASRAFGAESGSCTHATGKRIYGLSEEISKRNETMRDLMEKAGRMETTEAIAMSMANDVIPAMSALRESIDELESITATEFWPYPTYGEMLYSV